MITVVVLRLGWGNNSGDDGYLFICSFIYSFFFSADTHSYGHSFFSYTICLEAAEVAVRTDRDGVTEMVGITMGPFASSP